MTDLYPADQERQSQAALASVRDTMRQLPISRTTLYTLIDSGDLMRVKIGSRTFITQKSIDKYLERITAEAIVPTRR